MPQVVDLAPVLGNRAAGDILGRTPARARRMVIRRNVWCRVFATIFLPALAGAASATSENHRMEPSDVRPDAGAVVQSYLTLAGWVRDLDPPDPRTPQARTPIAGAMVSPSAPTDGAVPSGSPAATIVQSGRQDNHMSPRSTTMSSTTRWP